MRASIYSVHPGIAMVQRAVADLPARTRWSFEQWIVLIKKQVPRNEASRRLIDADLMRWLERAHEMDR